MNRSIVKPVIAGILIGLGLFFIPFFIIRVALFFLVAALIVRLFIGRGRRWGSSFGERRLAFTDHIRNMSEEEYTRFKQKFAYGHGCGAFRKEEFSTQQKTQS